ncbi:hypothetical protein ACHAW6_008339 [Cyclotella cf. meneghiniana]
MISTSSSSRNNIGLIKHAPPYNVVRCASKETTLRDARHHAVRSCARTLSISSRDIYTRKGPPTYVDTTRREDFLKRFERPSKRSRSDLTDDSSLSPASHNGSSGEARYSRNHNRQRTFCPSMKSFNKIQELIRCAFKYREQMNPSSLAAFWNHASYLLNRESPGEGPEPLLGHELQCLYVMSYDSVEDFGSIHLSEILNAMGKIVKQDRPGSRYQAFFHDLLVRDGVGSKNSIFQAFANIISRRLDKFDTRAIANIVMAFVHIGLVPKCNDGSTLFDHIARQALRSISHFNSKGLSKLAWSFAKVNQRHPQLFSAIAQASEICMAEFNPQDISIMLWGFAHVEERDARLFDLAAKRATSCLSDFKPQELTNTVHAFAITKQQNHTFFQKVGDEAVAQIHSFIPQNLANIVWAYATLGMPHPRLFEAVAKKTIISSSEFSSQDLSNTAWAYATAKVYKPYLFDVIVEKAIAILDDFEPQHLSNIVWAFATLKLPHHCLFETVADAVLRRQTEFSSKQISNLIWSYAYVPVGSVNKQLFSKLESTVIASIDDCDTQYLANIAWSYAVANVEAPLLFQRRSPFVNAILSRREKFNIRELCQLHQWILWQKEIESELTLDSSFQKLCYNAYTKRLPNPSGLQNSVMTELKSIGLEPQEEYRLADCGYILDALVEVNGKSVGIEVDGPSHFAGREPLGKVTLKHRQVLNIEGIRLVSVPYWNWDGNANRQEYLKLTLDMVC